MSIFDSAAITMPEPTFDFASTPGRLSVASGLPDATLRRQISAGFDRHGFVIAHLPEQHRTPEALVEFGRALELDEPYVLPVYRTHAPEIATPVSRVSAAHNANSSAAHPSFGRPAGQPLHVDGTSMPIGTIQTTLLLCQTAALEGGDTELFNAVAAYRALLRCDEDAAATLAMPGSLIRQATIGGATDENAGPAFAVQDGRLVTRYSVNHPDIDRWAVPENTDEKAFWRGVEFLAEMASPGSPYYHRLTLEPGDLLILANSQLAHSRTSYTDRPEAPRCLFRTLHLRRLTPA
jgi:alpha-ketoglutarate-dependent taurine dioxygenase